jgi:hypothetical protein
LRAPLNRPPKKVGVVWKKKSPAPARARRSRTGKKKKESASAAKKLIGMQERSRGGVGRPRADHRGAPQGCAFLPVCARAVSPRLSLKVCLSWTIRKDVLQVISDKED